MSAYMYILECSDKTYYTGSTTDLNLRLEQHQSGFGANYTRERLPVKLIYYEEFSRIEDAFYREKQVQGWSRKKKEALMNNEFEKLIDFSECKNDTHYKNRLRLRSATDAVKKCNDGRFRSLSVVEA